MDSDCSSEEWDAVLEMVKDEATKLPTPEGLFEVVKPYTANFKDCILYLLRFTGQVERSESGGGLQNTFASLI